MSSTDPTYAFQLEGVTRAVGFPRGLSFDWFGERAFHVPDRSARALAEDTAQAVLLNALQNHIYQNFYVTGGPLEARRTPFLVDTGLESLNFKQELFGANALGIQMATWKVEEQQAARYILSRKGMRVQSTREILSERGAGALREGDHTTIQTTSAFSRLSPGFVLFQSGEGGSEKRVLRFYWHVLPRGAALLVREITQKLGATGLPFSFKILARPSSYERCDAGVLYLAQEYLPEFAPLLSVIYASLSDFLCDPVPAMTLRMATGLGVAEDPGDGSSFGMTRSDMISAALLSVRSQGSLSVSKGVKAIRHAFEKAGLDPQRPYLGVESDGNWERLLSFRPPRRRPKPKVKSVTASGLAEELADTIARRALWHDGRCTWMGAANEIARIQADRRVTALDGSLYDGTSGLAVLFAELAAAGGGRAAAETALGALRHAASRSAVTPNAQISGYSGPIGVAWAAGAVAHLLKCDEAAGIAQDTLDGLANENFTLGESDFLTGTAGAAQALLSLQKVGLLQTSHPLFTQIAEQLKTSAVRSVDGSYWRGKEAPKGQPGLTGFSHGGSGHAVALIGLGHALRDDACLSLAAEALRYENLHFDPGEGNWQDLRFARTGGAPSFSNYWCHGAPGIGLARALIAEHVDWPGVEDEQQAGLRTTASIVSRMATSPQEAHCLCHGLPGNAVVLARQIAASNSPVCPETRAALDDANSAMILAYGAQDRSYRRSPLDSGTPSVMIGLGGIVFYFLFTAGMTKTNFLDLSLT